MLVLSILTAYYCRFARITAGRLITFRPHDAPVCPLGLNRARLVNRGHWPARTCACSDLLTADVNPERAGIYLVISNRHIGLTLCALPQSTISGMIRYS